MVGSNRSRQKGVVSPSALWSGLVVMVLAAALIALLMNGFDKTTGGDDLFIGLLDIGLWVLPLGGIGLIGLKLAIDGIWSAKPVSVRESIQSIPPFELFLKWSPVMKTTCEKCASKGTCRHRVVFVTRVQNIESSVGGGYHSWSYTYTLVRRIDTWLCGPCDRKLIAVSGFSLFILFFSLLGVFGLSHLATTPRDHYAAQWATGGALSLVMAFASLLYAKKFAVQRLYVRPLKEEFGVQKVFMYGHHPEAKPGQIALFDEYQWNRMGMFADLERRLRTKR